MVCIASCRGHPVHSENILLDLAVSFVVLIPDLLSLIHEEDQDQEHQSWQVRLVKVDMPV